MTARTTKSTPAKPTAKKTAPTPRRRTTRTVVDLRHPLPARRPSTGPHTPQQLTEARAALAAASARLPIPVINWQTLPDGRAGAYMADDTLIVHTAERAPHFTALVLCPHGRRHAHHITDQATLHTARTATRACTSPHDANDDQHQALTEGVTPPPPRPVVRAPKAITPIKVLADALAKSATCNDDTVQTDVTALRTADDETAKEHPNHG